MPCPAPRLVVLGVGRHALSRARCLRSARERWSSPRGCGRDGPIDVARLLVATDYVNGCPIATVALEVGPTVPAIADACTEAYTRALNRVAGWLRDDGTDAATATEYAFLVYAALEGALVFAKAQRSTEPIERLRAQLPLLLPGPQRRRARRTPSDSSAADT
jgi:hypothetical protein